MTNIETKKELNNEFKDLKFILTSGMRTKLLLAIYERSKNLEELRTELKKPSATILHGLKELEEISFIKKEKKYYSLTSNGYLLATNIIKLTNIITTLLYLIKSNCFLLLLFFSLKPINKYL